MTTPTIKPALPAGTILSQHAEFAISVGALADSDPESVTAPLDDDTDDPDAEPTSTVPVPAFSGGAS